MMSSIITTSSKSLVENTPNKDDSELLTKLAHNITHNYQSVKQKQEQYDHLSAKKKVPLMPLKDNNNETNQLFNGEENKLKRKKTLSSSLTSVTDTVNQEKRTRIEGVQLNCRGKLKFKGNPSNENMEKVAQKPPLPTNAIKNVVSPATNGSTTPPPRLKRQLQENVLTIQKLNALAEQLRLEINELKTNLNAERGAVRVLRAQNEAETRKWKGEVKKLQNMIETLKKDNAVIMKKLESTEADNAAPLNSTSLVNYEIQRLTNEINHLKENNKTFEGKKVINSDADKRKAADMRELKDSYELRLSQVQKSAKIEITRLLEEIKSKERNIGQLKRDLQILQNTHKFTNSDLMKPTVISRNATTINPLTNKQQATTTNITTTMPTAVNNCNCNNNNNNNNNKKMRPTLKVGNNIKLNKQQQEQQQNKKQDINKRDQEDNNKRKIINKVQHCNEISKLTNIELINNTKNVSKPQNVINDYHNNNKSQIQAHTEGLTLNSVQQRLKALVTQENDDKPKMPAHYITTTTPKTTIEGHNEALTKTSTTRTTTTTTINDQYEDQQLTKELEQHLLQSQQQHNEENNENTTKTIDHHHLHQQPQESHQQLNHNSDSDSALSSAPPSISPQPAANDVETADIWQTIRSYTQDTEKLQKEVQVLEQQNSSLRKELQLAKEQIIELEKSTLESSTVPKPNSQLLERLKYLEEHEHQLQDECNDLREQNELLEFRILELEESNDKSHNNPDSSCSLPSFTTLSNDSKNIWLCSASSNSTKTNSFDILFGGTSNNSTNITSINGSSNLLMAQSNLDDTIACGISNEEMCLHVSNLLEKQSLEVKEKQCLRQVLMLMQQLVDFNARSCPVSLNTAASSDEAISLELVKAPASDNNCGLPAVSSLRFGSESSNQGTSKSSATNSARIIATVQPYNSNPTCQYTSTNTNHSPAPQNSAIESPRKVQHQSWQSNSLSESGVFVESDFLSDTSEQHVYTQTDFEDRLSPLYSVKHSQLQLQSPIIHKISTHKNSNSCGDQKRLEYYKERLDLLERKVLIYESSGDVQTKHLADRLQREVQLEKEVKDLRDRVDFLVRENANLDEEKCEFEEAENDTRLRLQRLEVELEILSQRNVELEFSREALSAKYKDCHSECLNLRDDLATSETQIRHLEEDKQKAKENLEFLHSTLPLFLIINSLSILNCCQSSTDITSKSTITLGNIEEMGSQTSLHSRPIEKQQRRSNGGADNNKACEQDADYGNCIAQQREIQYLKEEIKCLCHQIKELNSRHYAAMESADSHWVELEREYKEREDQFRAKEFCLKQKIQKLQDCLCDDSRAANEKICQLEEAEESLKTCLVRVTKEHRELQEHHKIILAELERSKEQGENMKKEQKPLLDAFEQEKKRNKALSDELNFMRKLQQETENRSKAELDAIRSQVYEIKKEFLHIEVTNGELKEEVSCLEQQVETLQNEARENQDKVRCLTDEIRTKEEMCQKLEKQLERSEGFSLADELSDSPSKRLRREEVRDLKTATMGLGRALKIVKQSEPESTPEVRRIFNVAEEVSKLARSLLQENDIEKEEEKVKEDIKKDTNTKDSSMSLKQQSEQNIENDVVDEEVGEEHVEEQVAEESLEREEGGEQPLTDSTSHFNAYVGMALMPEFRFDENIWPSCSQEMKKVIYEVPSELRKLSTASPIPKVQALLRPSTHLIRRKRGKHSIKIRMTRGRCATINARLRRIVSCINARQSETSFHDASELDFCQSEVLERKLSYTSFHSVRDELNDVPIGIDVSTETEIKQATVDTGTETLVPKTDSSVQVNDEIDIETQINNNIVPAHIHCFLSMLKGSAPRTHSTSNVFNMKLNKHWESNEDFRQGLEIIAAFAAFKSDDVIPISLQNYEDFVSAMSCLHLLRELFKPIKIPLLNQIEEQLNENLMIFHNRKMESEFYCTVYYPVKRPDPNNFTKYPTA